MANCTGSCGGSANDILRDILDQDIATGVRLTQTVQAFEAANGASQSNQPASSVAVTTSCADAKIELLEGILAQRQYNFDALQRVLLAV